MKTSKITINWFVDFDKEEQWLNDMAKKGWAFWHTNGVIYRFNPCKPGEFIYQIDFDEKKSKEGIDDYVVKPFSPKELMMRVGAVIRRSGEAEKKTEETVSVGGLTVDFTARRVIVDGVEAELSPKEYDLLFYMIRNRGIALTREKLISDVWGYDFFGDDRTLDTHIKLLRKQLGPYADKITTLRGVGYRFEKE